MSVSAMDVATDLVGTWKARRFVNPSDVSKNAYRAGETPQELVNVIRRNECITVTPTADARYLHCTYQTTLPADRDKDFLIHVEKPTRVWIRAIHGSNRTHQYQLRTPGATGVLIWQFVGTDLPAHNIEWRRQSANVSGVSSVVLPKSLTRRWGDEKRVCVCGQPMCCQQRKQLPPADDIVMTLPSRPTSRNKGYQKPEQKRTSRLKHLKFEAHWTGLPKRAQSHTTSGKHCTFASTCARKNPNLKRFSFERTTSTTNVGVSVGGIA